MLKFAILLTALAVCYGQRTKYILLTHANRRGTPLPASGTFTADQGFDVENDTIILIHGHQGGPADAFNTRIRSEILTHRQHHQIIEVDWEGDASAIYATASRTVPLIAEELAKVISELKAQPETLADGTVPDPVAADVKKMHLVGFGLGAHVAGIASRQLGVRVGRITGLDPAGRGWDTPTSGHLRRGDADYVEVIHTDGSRLLANGIGTAIGEVDFYVNGGSNQPGCFGHFCCHNRAYEVFAASLSNTNLVGYPCSSMTQMNLNRCRGDALLVGDTKIDKTDGITAFAIYRINTRRSWPF